MNEVLPLYPGAKPCVQSGMCCRTGPCAFGEWDAEKKQCTYLKDLEDGRTQCGRYEEILGMPRENWEWNPAFGAGCCMSLFNDARQVILERMRREGRDNGDSGCGDTCVTNPDVHSAKG